MATPPRLSIIGLARERTRAALNTNENTRSAIARTRDFSYSSMPYDLTTRAPWKVCSSKVVNWPISSCVLTVTLRIRLPNRAIGITATGKTTKAMRPSCQSCQNITPTNPMSDKKSLPRPVSAFETAARIILMSMVKREIRLPVGLS